MNEEVMDKPLWCLDFDGVLHAYTSGWQGADVIADEAVAGAMTFILEALEVAHLAVYSSRSSVPEGVAKMKEWLTWRMFWHLDKVEPSGGRSASDVINQLQFPTEKPAAAVYIDDRGWQFNGTFPSVAELLAFKPWYLRNPQD